MGQKFIYVILSTLLGIATFACKQSPLENSAANRPECKTFFDIVSSEWELGENRLFSYSNHPKYWPPNSTFFKDLCLIGQSREFIVTLFGLPSKTFFINESEIMIYCTTENCVGEGLGYNTGVNIVLSQESNRVIEAYQNPLGVDSSHSP